MAWDDDKPGLMLRLDTLDAHMSDLPADMRRRLTEACNSVRAQAAVQTAQIETELRAAISGLQSRLDIAVILLACMLGVVGWVAYQRDGLSTYHANAYSVSSERRLEELVEVILTMDKAKVAWWTVAGLPRIEVLERRLSERLGYLVRVTVAERRLALLMAKGVRDGD